MSHTHEPTFHIHMLSYTALETLDDLIYMCDLNILDILEIFNLIRNSQYRSVRRYRTYAMIKYTYPSVYAENKLNIPNLILQGLSSQLLKICFFIYLLYIYIFTNVLSRRRVQYIYTITVEEYPINCRSLFQCTYNFSVSCLILLFLKNSIGRILFIV